MIPIQEVITIAVIHLNQGRLLIITDLLTTDPADHLKTREEAATTDQLLQEVTLVTLGRTVPVQAAIRQVDLLVEVVAMEHLVDLLAEVQESLQEVGLLQDQVALEVQGPGALDQVEEVIINFTD